MAQEATKKVTFKDIEYTVSSTPLEDLDALEALEDNRYAACAKAILGAKQYALFRKDNKKSSDLFELVNALLDAGEEDAEDKE